MIGTGVDIFMAVNSVSPDAKGYMCKVFPSYGRDKVVWTCIHVGNKPWQ